MEDNLSWPVQVDAWVVAILGAAFIGMLGSGVAVWLDPGATEARLPVLVMILALFAGVRGMLVPTRYDLSLDELRWRSGLLHGRLGWADLVRLERTWSLVSSLPPVWTPRRLRLVDVRGRVLEVGPRDPQGFLAEVLARAPQLVSDPTSRGRAWHDPARERPRHRRRWW